MIHHRLQPVQSIENLRDRVDRLFRGPRARPANTSQLAFDTSKGAREEFTFSRPTRSVAEFLDFMANAVPDGDVYLFGGVLRDLALLGNRGFDSDIDVVVEGSWHNCIAYLESLGASKNKFGGYRLQVAGWPVDIWNASETWAIRQGLVAYRGIASLTETTVLNWDAILMNWRSRVFVHGIGYIESIHARILDIVLEKNPNPLGMAVRVFRHLCLKDAKQITEKAATYLTHCAGTYSLGQIQESEQRSYGQSIILPQLFRLFERFHETNEALDFRSRYGIATDLLKQELELF